MGTKETVNGQQKRRGRGRRRRRRRRREQTARGEDRGQRGIKHMRAQRTKDTQSKDIVLDGGEQKTIAIARD
jgi:hypothetical protein